MSTRLALSALRACLPTIMISAFCSHCVSLLKRALKNQHNSYWLVKVEFIIVYGFIQKIYIEVVRSETQTFQSFTVLVFLYLQTGLKRIFQEISKINKA